MTSTFMLRVALLFSAWFLLAPSSAAAQAIQAGDRVTVINWDARFKAGSKLLGKPEFGESFTVDKVDGDWLWFKNKGGYLKRSDVVPYDHAIGHFTNEIRRNPTSAAYNSRGAIWYERGELDIALGDYNEAIRLDPQNSDGNNEIAWILATCPEARYRDGGKAVQHATRACELTDWKDASILDTLAAALAEQGHFTDSVKRQQQAVELATEPQKADFRSRLVLYQSRQPYRDQPAESAPP